MKFLAACLNVFLLLLKTVHGSMAQFNPIENLFGGTFLQMDQSFTNTTTRLFPDPHAPTPEEREAERLSRRERMRERNERVKEAIKYLRPDTVERVSDEDFERIQEEHPSLRKLGWTQWNDKTIKYADPGEDYDMWSQAYRMLGAFIDCDHKIQQGGSHDNNNNNGNNDDQSCSRWMLWASVSHANTMNIFLRSRRWPFLPIFFPNISSMLTPTTREMVITSISETAPRECLIATNPILIGFCLGSIAKSFISSLNRSRNTCGLLMNMSTSWQWRA